MGRRGSGGGWARPGSARLLSLAVPCARSCGARSPRSAARRRSSAVHVRPRRVCLWRTRLRAERSGAEARGSGEGGRKEGGGGGTAAGAGAANLASRPRRGPGVTGAPPPPGTLPGETRALRASRKWR
nr:unnamed protein product [Rangifer tarandus platyrhynchus]